MRHLLTSSSVLAIVEHGRQEQMRQIAGNDSVNAERKFISAIRILTPEEKSSYTKGGFEGGDIQYAWYGIFDLEGVMIGITDDYQQLRDFLLEDGVKLQETSGFQ